VQQSYRLLAARYLRKQAKQLAAQLDGIRRADDIEHVHRARVASRRLRAAMALFYNCFGRKKMKRWRKQIERVTDQLGAARDMDVHSEYLCRIMTQAPSEAFPGTARLLVHIEKRRARLQAQVLRAVDRLERSGVLDEMRRTSKRVLSRAKSKDEQTALVAYGEIRRQMLQQLEELRAYEDGLQHPEDQERHHAMRIAAKSLRYTMEIAAPIYHGGLDEPIRAVKHVQSLLGQIHDCDVWLEELDRFAASERRKIVARYASDAPFARLEPGIEFVRRDRQQCREQTFAELVRFWQELEEQGLWRRLVETIEAPLSLRKQKRKQSQPRADLKAASPQLLPGECSEPDLQPQLLLETPAGRAGPPPDENSGDEGHCERSSGRVAPAPDQRPHSTGRLHSSSGSSGRHGATVG